MRLFILAIVAGLGVLVGVALYVGQEIVNPGTPDSKITARLAEEQEAIAVAEKADGSDKFGVAEKSATSAVSDDIDAGSEPSINAYKAQLRTAQYPAGTTSFDSKALRKQLPDIFQFPEQNAPPPPPIAIATELTTKSMTPPAPAAGSNGVVPDAPTASDQSDVRSDSPMLKHLTAPEHKPSVLTATNPNVQIEVAPAAEGRAARTRMIVSK